LEDLTPVGTLETMLVEKIGRSGPYNAMLD